MRPAAYAIATTGSGASPVIRSDSHRLSKRSRSRVSTTSPNSGPCSFVRAPRPTPMRTFTSGMACAAPVVGGVVAVGRQALAASGAAGRGVPARAANGRRRRRGMGDEDRRTVRRRRQARSPTTAASERDRRDAARGARVGADSDASAATVGGGAPVPVQGRALVVVDDGRARSRRQRSRRRTVLAWFIGTSRRFRSDFSGSAARPGAAPTIRTCRPRSTPRPCSASTARSPSSPAPRPGLGDRFARVLDAVGARVVIAARRADRLEALAAEPHRRRRRAGRPRRARRPRAARRDDAGRGRAPRRARQQRRHRPQGVARGRAARRLPARDGGQRDRDLAPLQAGPSTPSSPTVAAASSTSPRCSATSGRRRSSRRATAPARAPSSTSPASWRCSSPAATSASTPCARAGSSPR